MSNNKHKQQQQDKQQQQENTTTNNTTTSSLLSPHHHSSYHMLRMLCVKRWKHINTIALYRVGDVIIFCVHKKENKKRYDKMMIILILK